MAAEIDNRHVIPVKGCQVELVLGRPLCAPFVLQPDQRSEQFDKHRSRSGAEGHEIEVLLAVKTHGNWAAKFACLREELGLHGRCFTAIESGWRPNLKKRYAVLAKKSRFLLADAVALLPRADGCRFAAPALEALAPGGPAAACRRRAAALGSEQQAGGPGAPAAAGGPLCRPT